MSKPEKSYWHAVGDGAFARPFGTIRVCRGCGCLVAGGPTACARCVRDEEREAASTRRNCISDPVAVAEICRLRGLLAKTDAQATELATQLTQARETTRRYAQTTLDQQKRIEVLESTLKVSQDQMRHYADLAGGYEARIAELEAGASAAASSEVLALRARVAEMENSRDNLSYELEEEQERTARAVQRNSELEAKLAQAEKTRDAAQAASTADRLRARLLPYATRFDFGAWTVAVTEALWNVEHDDGVVCAQFDTLDGALAWLREQGVEAP